MRMKSAQRPIPVRRDEITRKWEYRDQERKETLNLRKLKSLIDEFEFYKNKFNGGTPRSVRDRLYRLQQVIEVKTAIYEEAMKNG